MTTPAAKKQKETERNRIEKAHGDEESIIFNQFLRQHKKVIG